MSAITLEDLRARVRLHADQPNADQGKDDTDVNLLINDACAEYYDLLVSVRGQEYYATSAPISITANTNTYDLPSDFYQLLSVTAEWARDEHEIIHAIPTEAQVARFNNLNTWDRSSPKGFRIRSEQSGNMAIDFFPMPRSSVTVRLRYVPTFVALASDGDVIDCVNAWWTLIVLKAAAQFRGLLGLPNDYLKSEWATQLERLTTMATERLADEPHQIVDVSPEESSSWFRPQRWFWS